MPTPYLAALTRLRGKLVPVGTVLANISAVRAVTPKGARCNCKQIQLCLLPVIGRHTSHVEAAEIILAVCVSGSRGFALQQLRWVGPKQQHSDASTASAAQVEEVHTWHTVTVCYQGYQQQSVPPAAMAAVAAMATAGVGQRL